MSFLLIRALSCRLGFHRPSIGRARFRNGVARSVCRTCQTAMVKADGKWRVDDGSVTAPEGDHAEWWHAGGPFA